MHPNIFGHSLLGFCNSLSCGNDILPGVNADKAGLNTRAQKRSLSAQWFSNGLIWTFIPCCEHSNLLHSLQLTTHSTAAERSNVTFSILVNTHVRPDEHSVVPQWLKLNVHKAHGEHSNVRLFLNLSAQSAHYEGSDLMFLFKAKLLDVYMCHGGYNWTLSHSDLNVQILCCLTSERSFDCVERSNVWPLPQLNVQILTYERSNTYFLVRLNAQIPVCEHSKTSNTYRLNTHSPLVERPNTCRVLNPERSHYELNIQISPSILLNAQVRLHDYSFCGCVLVICAIRSGLYMLAEVWSHVHGQRDESSNAEIRLECSQSLIGRSKACFLLLLNNHFSHMSVQWYWYDFYYRILRSWCYHVSSECIDAATKLSCASGWGWYPNTNWPFTSLYVNAQSHERSLTSVERSLSSFQHLLLPGHSE